MKHFDYYEELAWKSFGLDPSFGKKCPPIVTGYYAYKNGECRKYTDKASALKFTYNIEEYPANKKELDAWHQTIRDVELRAFDLWIEDLHNEYCISDEVFNVCYRKAYEDGHAYGYDEVRCKMDSYVDFAVDIMALNEEMFSKMTK